MFDLHRHDEYSTFDGFGKAFELVEVAKELGHTALCTTNHGNTNGLIQTYKACKENGLKAILGVEGYFLPKWREKTRGFHLVLVAKNLKGYGNMNRIQYEGDAQKFYNPIWDFSLLEKYHEGLICTTACAGGYLGQCIKAGKLAQAEKFLRKMQSIFGEDLYVEVQPYKISEEGLQETINAESIRLADKLGIKCILTSDSHRGRKEELGVYMKMHEVAGHNFDDIEATYADRYMPTEQEIVDRFVEMHTPSMNGHAAWSVDKTVRRAKQMIANLDEIEQKCELNYLDQLELKLPKLGGEADTTKLLKSKVLQGLKERGKCTPEYKRRCKEELEVIIYHGFEDYFLIVSDYVNWAKAQGIAVGPGRGSVCNSLVAYALKITDVDSLLFKLDFRRFLRKDKKKFPDIDLDFETARRGEVIEYLCEKYKGHAARICSYGLYKVDNLINDLAKVSGLACDKETESHIVEQNKREIADIKKLVNGYVVEGVLNKDGLLDDPMTAYYDRKYDNIVTNFTMLYKKVRYIGTHAAGVAITGGNILDYTALRRDANGYIYTAYDLSDIENVNVIKFDILGLKTEQSIQELRRATGVTVSYDEIVNDPKLIEQFRAGNCDGVFQFENATPRNILMNIECDCFEDIVAASSMNRPGPLTLKMPDKYAANKQDSSEAQKSAFWEYTKETYGTIIYQEQVQQICVNIARMSWPDADKVTKFMKSTTGATEQALQAYEKNKAEIENKFVDGAMEYGGMKEDEARQLFDDMICYTFNRGHAVGYSLISVEEMFYKVYYPLEYWFCKLKYAKDDKEFARFCERAAAGGALVFLPHVNYSQAKCTMRKVEGDKVLQQGLANIKGVGEKAADFIFNERKQNGIFTSYDNFIDRCKSRVVTKKVIDLLKEQGALEFNKKIFIKRVTKYNSALYMRGSR